MENPISAAQSVNIWWAGNESLKDLFVSKVDFQLNKKEKNLDLALSL